MKTVLITGANRGIGFALTTEYLSKGWRVLSACRNSSTELDASGAQVITGIDVTDPTALSRLVTTLGQMKLDLLINNAGILSSDILGDLEPDSLSQQLQVNAIAPLLLTEAVLPYLNQSAKIAFITSRMGSIADNTSGGYYGYRMSKAALNAAAKSLSLDLQARGIAVAILHPGFVQTAMVNFAGDIPATESARRLSQRIADLNVQNSGNFWHSNGDVLPW